MGEFGEVGERAGGGAVAGGEVWEGAIGAGFGALELLEVLAGAVPVAGGAGIGGGKAWLGIAVVGELADAIHLPAGVDEFVGEYGFEDGFRADVAADVVDAPLEERSGFGGGDGEFGVFEFEGFVRHKSPLPWVNLEAPAVSGPEILSAIGPVARRRL